MESLFQIVMPPHPCEYLPREMASMEYEDFLSIQPAEYLGRLRQGWRRFGHTLFRPQCQSCHACQSLRVVVDRFRPDRAQRRVRHANEGQVQVRIGKPFISEAKLRLYDRYHAFQTGAKGWPAHPAKDAAVYAATFLDNPFPTQEWCYFLGGRLIGVGYIDVLPGGLSAIYFYYDPDERDRSLGTWNVLNILDYAAATQVQHVYLGYYVPECRSLAYKARFRPNEVLGHDGNWQPHFDNKPNTEHKNTY